MEWVKENFPLLSGLAGFVTATVGGVLTLYRILSGRLDEKMNTRVNGAMSEIMQDFSQVRERVATLEAHFIDSKEDIQEIKGKLDTLGGHVLQLPNKLAEVLKR